MKLEKSAACKCSGIHIKEDGLPLPCNFTPNYYQVDYIEELNRVVFIIGGEGKNGKRARIPVELEASEAAKFGADIVAAATGIKE